MRFILKGWQKLAGGRLPGETVDIAFAEDLANEVRSRRDRYLRGESQLHSWDEVRNELNEIIARRGQP